MINWAYFLAALALTAAAPAPQNVQNVQSGQPQRVQTQTFRLQPVQFQSSAVSSPFQYQLQSPQPVQYSQTYQQYPQFSTVPLGVQSFVQQQPQVTVQQIPSSVQSFVQQQPQVSTVQSFVQQQPQVSTVQSFQQVPSYSVQSVPQVSTVNSIPSFSVQQVSTPKPVVTQVTHHSTALPIVHATPTPSVRISSTPVSIPVTQVHHVQHSVPVQVQPVTHTVTHHAVPVQTVQSVQPVTHTVTHHSVPVQTVQPVTHTVTHHSVPVQQSVHTVEHKVQNVNVQQNARSEGGAILRYVQDVRENGFDWAYETENGIKAQEQGELKDAGSDNEKLSVTGSYSYTDPDGRLISVQYIADEYGFRPVGDIIHEQILKSIDSQYNYAKSVPHDDTK